MHALFKRRQAQIPTSNWSIWIVAWFWLRVRLLNLDRAIHLRTSGARWVMAGSPIHAALRMVPNEVARMQFGYLLQGLAYDPS